MKVLEKLMEGNQFYISNRQNPAVFDDARRKELTENGQKPYAVIVTCADSRVVPEHIFSAGLGDLFVIRNAGNVIGEHEIGSVEYAAEHLGVSFVTVMGHTHCGAVEAAMKGNAEGYVKMITDKVKTSFMGECNARICEKKNALAGVQKLTETPLLSELIKEGKLTIMPAIYNIESGAVEFFSEKSPAEE